MTYSVNQDQGTASIVFNRPARINRTALEAALPADVKVQDIQPQGSGTAIILSVPETTRLKHYGKGPKVVVDLMRNAAPATASAPAAPPPAAPAAAPAKTDMAKAEPAKSEPAKSDLPKAELPKAEAAPQPEKPAEKAKAAAPTNPAPAAPTAPPPAVAKEQSADANLAQLVAQQKNAPQADAAKAPSAVSLGVGFDQPSGVAAFRRAGWLWLVFDRKAEIDTKLLKRTGGDVVMFVEQVPGLKTGTAIRLITKQGYNPSIRKEGQLWVFDLSQQPLQPTAPIPVDRQFDFQDRGRLILPVAETPPQALQIRDPEVGDLIQVTPLVNIGNGVRASTVVPGAELLPTAHGVVLVPLADGVRLDSYRNQVEVAMPGGLHLSKGADAKTADAAKAATPEALVAGTAPAIFTQSRPLEMARWNRGGLDKFYPEHEKLMQRLAVVKPDEKNLQRLELARHYLSNGMPAEAIGIVNAMASQDPTVLDDPNVRGVRGVGNVMMRRFTEGIDDLSHPSLAKDLQAPLWIAAARAEATGDLAKQGLMLRSAADEIKGQPPHIRMFLGRIAARSTAAAGDGRGANKVIEAMNGPGLLPRDLNTISYLQGLAAEANKQWDTAVVKFQEAEEGDSRPDRAYAGRERIELQLKRGQITPMEAYEQLEKLRFAWRGEDFEFQLIKRLAEFLLVDKRYAEALRRLQEISQTYYDNPDVGSITKVMNDTFEDLFLNGGADKLSPITAIGLYDEFHELTPQGQKGDEMIRKLADRLASVDLLDRSAELLRHQVQFRLQGLEKAKVGARLALLQLTDKKGADALDSLDMSEMPDLPPELADQRRLMRVRALTLLGRSGEALALIINDQSEAAKQMRADIYWDLKKWPEAATAMEQLIDRSESLAPAQPATAQKLVDLAAAMILARDERGLMRLRRTWGPSMAKSDMKNAFDLLTSEPERGIVDYRNLGDKIKQVQNFQLFMNAWQQKMQTNGLSSIN